MSLGGIAISIGVLVDAAIIMVENAHKHYEEWRGAGDPTCEIITALGAGGGADAVLHAAGDHRVVPAGVHPRGAGGEAVQTAGLHQDLRHGHGLGAAGRHRPFRS